MRKVCRVCNKSKKVSKFGKLTASNDGFCPRCKRCEVIRVALYGKTKKGVATSLYGHQVSHSKARCHVAPTYSKMDFSEWLLSKNKFHKLFSKWEKSNYNRWKYPSVDRINPKLPYTLDNIRVMSWKKNSDLNIIRPVLKYTLDDVLMCKYNSIKEAALDTKVCAKRISDMCNGVECANRHKTFIWRYSDD